MCERIIVDGTPVSPHEGGNQQDQGTLRLVEVRDHEVHQAETEARDDDNPGTDLELRQLVRLQIGDNRLQGLLRAVGIRPFIGCPLRDILRLPLLDAAHTHVIERFQGPDRSGSNSNQRYACCFY